MKKTLKLKGKFEAAWMMGRKQVLVRSTQIKNIALNLQIRDLRADLTNQTLQKCQSSFGQLHLILASFELHVGEKCLSSSLLSDFIQSVHCWKCVFHDSIYAQTPKRPSGLAEPSSAPNVITDFPLLSHPCSPNATSCNLRSSCSKGSRSDGAKSSEQETRRRRSQKSLP